MTFAALSENLTRLIRTDLALGFYPDTRPPPTAGPSRIKVGITCSCNTQCHPTQLIMGPGIAPGFWPSEDVGSCRRLVRRLGFGIDPPGDGPSIDISIVRPLDTIPPRKTGTRGLSGDTACCFRDHTGTVRNDSISFSSRAGSLRGYQPLKPCWVQVACTMRA